MKKTQIIAFLILIGTVNLFAQNWQPVNKNKIYNYQTDTADFITNTIKVDSVNIIEGDSVFYLNRIMTNCDTCENNNYNDFALKNQPQFLMKKMIKKTDSLFIFQDTSEFSIMPLLNFGQSWIYNAENNINAVISYEGESNVFGITDSIKYINLSNGNQIILSKNNGILQFPLNSERYYNLSGVECNVEIGEALPDFWNFHNYEVGDIFQRMDYSESWGDGYYADFFIKKYEIISKEISNNSVSYNISGWTKHIDILDAYPMMQYDTTAYTFEETITFTDSSEHFTNCYPNELIDIGDYINFFGNEIMLNKVEVFKENGLYIKKAGSICDEPGEHCEWFPYYIESPRNSDFLVRNSYGGPDEIEIRYIEECGLSFKFWYFEFAGGDIFMGKVHNGDTIGTVYSDSHFEQYVTNIAEINTQNILIYPNPISIGQTLQIRTNAEIKTYNIYNISGLKVLSGNYFGEISINSLSSGIYILELMTNNEIFRKKIIVK